MSADFLWHSMHGDRSKMTIRKLSEFTMHIHTLQCFKWRKRRHFLHILHHKALIKKVQEVNFDHFFFLFLRSKGLGGWRGGGAGISESYGGSARKRVMYAFFFFSSWFCHTWGSVINSEIVLHFERVVVSHLIFFLSLSLRSAFSHLWGTKMAPVPDSVLMCLAVSCGEYRSLEWWQSREFGGRREVTRSSSWWGSTVEAHTGRGLTHNLFMARFNQ